MNVPLPITILVSFLPLFRKIQLAQVAQDIVEKLVELRIRELIGDILRRYPACSTSYSNVEQPIVLICRRSVLREEVVCFLND